jgi:hypothetical protein
MPAYCTRTDVYHWIPSGSVSNPGRHVSSVSTATSVITVDGHGYSDGIAVTLRAEVGGMLPAPLVAGATYYVRDATEATFRLCASPDSSSIAITTAGKNVVVVAEIPWNDWIAAASEQVECLIPAHATPLSPPYPRVVANYVALIVAGRALSYSGKGSELLTDERDRAERELEIWRKNGIPIRAIPGEDARGAYSRIVKRERKGTIP